MSAYAHIYILFTQITFFCFVFSKQISQDEGNSDQTVIHLGVSGAKPNKPKATAGTINKYIKLINKAEYLWGLTGLG